MILGRTSTLRYVARKTSSTQNIESFGKRRTGSGEKKAGKSASNRKDRLANQQRSPTAASRSTPTNRQRKPRIEGGGNPENLRVGGRRSALLFRESSHQQNLVGGKFLRGGHEISPPSLWFCLQKTSYRVASRGEAAKGLDRCELRKG